MAGKTRDEIRQRQVERGLARAREIRTPDATVPYRRGNTLCPKCQALATDQDKTPTRGLARVMSTRGMLRFMKCFRCCHTFWAVDPEAKAAEIAEVREIMKQREVEAAEAPAVGDDRVVRRHTWGPGLGEVTERTTSGTGMPGQKDTQLQNGAAGAREDDLPIEGEPPAPPATEETPPAAPKEGKTGKAGSKRTGAAGAGRRKKTADL